MIAKPTLPEKNAIPRAISPGWNAGSAGVVGVVAAVLTGPRSGEKAGAGARRRPLRVRDVRASRSCTEIARAAPLKERAAGIAPAPFVERTHAAPRSLQTLLIWGMFGIGTPPLLALPNCGQDRVGRLRLDVRRCAAACSSELRLGRRRREVVHDEVLRRRVDVVRRGELGDHHPVDAEERHRRPWRSAGTWTTLNVTPAFWMSATAHGPVIQNGVCDFVNAVSQTE